MQAGRKELDIFQALAPLNTSQKYVELPARAGRALPSKHKQKVRIVACGLSTNLRHTVGPLPLILMQPC